MATMSRAQLMDRSNFVPRQNPLQIQIEREKERKEQEKKDRQKRLAELAARQAAWEVLAEEAARRRAVEEAARLAAYNEPLPEFAPKIRQVLREKMFSYIYRVMADAVRAVCGGDECPGKIKLAFRLSKLKMHGVEARLYINCSTPHIEIGDVWKRVSYRLENNFLKQFPEFELFGKAEGGLQFVPWLLHDFNELRKSGFQYPGEEMVLHLEIMEGKEAV